MAMPDTTKLTAQCKAPKEFKTRDQPKGDLTPMARMLPEFQMDPQQVRVDRVIQAERAPVGKAMVLAPEWAAAAGELADSASYFKYSANPSSSFFK